MQLAPLAINAAYSNGLGFERAALMNPSQLRSLSVGSGYAMDAAGEWQEPSAVESQELEEYSLGSGCPG